MTKITNERRRREIADLLESDDELPESYIDIPSKPAYQNDNRFDSDRFEWLDQYSTDDNSSTVSSDISEQEASEKPVLISKGALSKRDIFFVKSIEEYSTDATLLWFIEFLKFKSVQQKCSSCLVGEVFDNHYTISKPPLLDLHSNYYFKFIIK